MCKLVTNHSKRLGYHPVCYYNDIYSDCGSTHRTLPVKRPLHQLRENEVHDEQEFYLIHHCFSCYSSVMRST